MTRSSVPVSILDRIDYVSFGLRCARSSADANSMARAVPQIGSEGMVGPMPPHPMKVSLAARGLHTGTITHVASHTPS